MRRAVTAFLRLMLRLFFRRIELAGLDHIPADAPVMFAANHPNGLVDPLFFLCFAPRRVSVLAKAPLFRYTLIGSFVRALDSIPVYRKQDQTAGSNEETFTRAREVLRSGGSIVIFPEGTTHSEPQLRELKTGAARIALGAELPGLLIVPAGIYYTAKQTFRSEVLVWFGKPITVEGEVRELTAEIEKQLDSVTLQADSRAALALIARAEEIFSANSRQPLAAEFELRRRFVDGYHFLAERDPQRLEQLASMIRQYESELGGARLDPEDLTPHVQWRAVVRVLMLFPVAVVGIATHLLPYLAVDFFAKRLSKNEDEMTATIKFVASLLFYPLIWFVLAAIVWRFWSGGAGLITLIVVPILGYVALRFIEQLDEISGTARAILHKTRSRVAHARLVSHRQRIRDEILAVAEGMNR